MSIFPTGIATDSDLYVAVNNLSCLLTDNPLTVGATTVNVNSTTGFPTVGTISIDAEIIRYTGVTATSFTGCTRGFDGTTAASHTVGSQVDHNVVAVHHNNLKDEIIAIETHLGVNGANIVHISGTETITGAKTINALTLGGNMTAGGFKLTGLGAGTTNGDSLRYEQVVGVYALDSSVVHLSGTETITGQKTFSLATLFADGTESLPGLAFSADSDTGMYRPSANVLGLAAGGSAALLMGTTTLVVQSGRVLRNQDGTNANPAYGFDNDPDTGMYLSGANTLDFATNGGRRITIDATGNLIMRGGEIDLSDGTVSNPSLNFLSDPNTGFFWLSSDIFRAVAGGTAIFQIYRSSGSDYGLDMLSGSFLQVKDGSAAHPGLSFSDDTDNGIRRTATNTWAAVAGGTDVANFTTIGVSIKGTTTNDNASTGFVGELVSSAVTAVSAAATATYSDATSISLSAGDWDISVQGCWSSAGATWASVRTGVSITSGNSATGLTDGDTQADAIWASSSTTPLNVDQAVPMVRASLTGTTTYYLKIRSSYSAGGPPTFSGKIYARRVR